MFKSFTKATLCMLALLASYSAFAQNSFTLTGKVVDNKNLPIPGVNVVLKGTYTGTTTDLRGEYAIRVEERQLPTKLYFSYIGFANKEVEITRGTRVVDVVLDDEANQVDEIIVAASRVEERILEAPVTVEKVSQKQLLSSGQSEVFNALSHFKGVDVNSASMLNTSISMRGFNSPRSERMIQLVDYMDVQTPSLNLNPGNMLGLPEVDIQSIEMIYGPASALYGANAFNGVTVTNSKDPFYNEGLTVLVKGGTNSLLNGQLRYAQKVNNFLAWKITGEYFIADDWIAQNFGAQSTAIDPFNNAEGSPLGFNAINKYGDVSTVINGIGRVYTPGWSEQDLIGDDSKARLMRIHPSVSYLLTNKIKLTVDYKSSVNTSTLQSTARYRFKNTGTNQYKAELKGDDWFVRYYSTTDRSRDAYDLTFLGAFMNTIPVSGLSAFTGTPNQTAVPNYATLYFTTYGGVYQQAVLQGATPQQAQVAAQSAAQATVPVAGTEAFEQLKGFVVNSDIPGKGANINTRSTLNDLSAQYIYRHKIADLTAGGAFRNYRLGSDGTLFSDTNNVRIKNYEYGAYLQASKALAENRFKISAAARLDNFQNFDPVISPRVSLVSTFGKNREHNFRVSYNTAFRSPTQLDQYLFLDVGQILILGNSGNGFTGYNLGITDAAVIQGILGAAAQGLTYDVSPYVSQLEPLKLEQVKTYEVGYKGMIMKRVLIDMALHFSDYQNFIGARQFVGNVDGTPVNAVQFAQQAAGLVPGVTFNQSGNNLRVLQAAVNSSQLIKTQGLTTGFDFLIATPFNVHFNYAYNTISNIDALPRNFLTFFNTPRNKFNASASGDIDHFSYGINYRWTEGFTYEYSFAIGEIESYATLDASLAYKLEKQHTTFRVSGSNLFNTNNVQIFGGPSLGRLVVMSVMVEL